MFFTLSDPNTKDKDVLLSSYRRAIAAGGYECWAGQGLSLFIDSVSGKVGAKSTREQTGGMHSFRVFQGHLGKARLPRHSSSLGLVRELMNYLFASKGSMLWLRPRGKKVLCPTPDQKIARCQLLYCILWVIAQRVE